VESNIHLSAHVFLYTSIFYLVFYLCVCTSFFPHSWITRLKKEWWHIKLGSSGWTNCREIMELICT